MNPTFIKPRYDSGGYAGIPDRITEAFASKNHDAVILIFVDGFGWRFFEKFQEESFLRRMARDGRIEKLTSQFPSTTAAHVTTIHTRCVSSMASRNGSRFRKNADDGKTTGTSGFKESVVTDEGKKRVEYEILNPDRCSVSVATLP